MVAMRGDLWEYSISTSYERVLIKPLKETK